MKWASLESLFEDNENKRKQPDNEKNNNGTKWTHNGLSYAKVLIANDKQHENKKLWSGRRPWTRYRKRSEVSNKIISG